MLGDSRLATMQRVGMDDTEPATTTRWTLDPGHSAVGFSVRHMMIATVRGEFERYRADVRYDAAHPDATRIDATIEVASVNTREAKRDGDLRGELLFDAERHPAITFVSHAARAAGEGAIDVAGTLTIRGIAKDVTLAVRDITGTHTDLRGHQRMGATATAKIKRSDFGMTWNKTLDAGGVVVGDTVTIAIEVSVVKAS